VTATGWTKLSRRQAGIGAEDVPYEGVPGHLEPVLQNWVSDRLHEVDGLDEELQLRLRADWDLASSDGEDLLDVVDGILHWHPDLTWEDGDEPADGEPNPEVDAKFDAELQAWRRLATRLEYLLEVAGSAWRVNKRADGLERRIDETIIAAASAAADAATPDARTHLANAWRAAYGRKPDPDKAYDEAVLAVEAVACPLVSPRNDRATLGTVIRDLRNQTVQWELAFGDTSGQPAGISRLIEMLALLWEGQSRHAGSPNSRYQTQVEAEGAVHLAATLVQWLTGGVLRRRP
jgi:hypothetical protein